MGSHPTIKDVAKKAGVSITTVSFVLNKRTDVVISEEVKKRVAQIAQEMNYHPSAMAAGLAGKRTRNLGIVFYKHYYITNQYYSFVVQGIVKETMEKGYNLLFSHVEENYEGYQNLPKIIQEKNVDGILMLGLADPKMTADIQERKIPVVIIDPHLPLKNINTILIENKVGVQWAVEHLYNLGHRHIGLLTVNGVRPPSVHEREEGFDLALAKYGLSSKKDYRLESNSLTYQAGYEKVLSEIKRLKNMTALFCVNDEMAAGAMRAAREVGRQVPKDLSVVGFDNIIMSNYTDPPLTTVSVAKEFLGKLGVDRLLEMVESKDFQTVKKELVPVELVVRNSTGKPR